MSRLWEKEKGLELEKRGASSAWDSGRTCQAGGKTVMLTGRERGRDGGTEGESKELESPPSPHLCSSSEPSERLSK